VGLGGLAEPGRQTVFCYIMASEESNS